MRPPHEASGKEKGPELEFGAFGFYSAAGCVPTQLPVQYHRPGEASFPPSSGQVKDQRQMEEGRGDAIRRMAFPGKLKRPLARRADLKDQRYIWEGRGQKAA
jgi:hypothetical protein